MKTRGCSLLQPARAIARLPPLLGLAQVRGLSSPTCYIVGTRYSARTDWHQLNNILYAVTFLAQQNGRGKCCPHCMDTGHTVADCALAPRFTLHRPRSHHRMTPRRATAGGDGNRLDQPCYSWNEGRCSFPYCRYRHVCTRCGGETHCREATKAVAGRLTDPLVKGGVPITVTP